MALETTITLDLEFKEGNITVKSGDDDVEVIDYSDDEIIFESRLGINITGVEFLDLIKQFEIFQKALLVNFKLNQFSRDSFTKITTVEEHNTFLNTWNLDITPQNNPKLIDYQANGSAACEVARRRPR